MENPGLPATFFATRYQPWSMILSRHKMSRLA